MTRDEIRRRALRAAAAVSLTIGLVGCATAIEITDNSSSGQGGGGGAGDEGQGGELATSAATTTSASTGDPPVMADAGDDTPDAAALTDAGDDAQVNCMLATDYVACCQEHNWDFNAGCMAWGPPMPPAMAVS